MPRFRRSRAWWGDALAPPAPERAPVSSDAASTSTFSLWVRNSVPMPGYLPELFADPHLAVQPLRIRVGASPRLGVFDLQRADFPSAASNLARS